MYKNSNFDSSLGSSVPAFSVSRNFSVDIRYGTVFPKLITSMDFEDYVVFYEKTAKLSEKYQYTNQHFELP